MKLFAERNLYEYLEARRLDLKREVESQDQNYLFNVNETEYVDYLVGKYRVEPLVIGFDGQTASDREAMIPAQRFPADFPLSFPQDRGKTYRRQVIAYHLSFTGPQELLYNRPATPTPWKIEVSIEADTFSFDVINWRDDPDEIRRV